MMDKYFLVISTTRILYKILGVVAYELWLFLGVNCTLNLVDGKSVPVQVLPNSMGYLSKKYTSD